MNTNRTTIEMQVCTEEERGAVGMCTDENNNEKVSNRTNSLHTHIYIYDLCLVNYIFMHILYLVENLIYNGNIAVYCFLCCCCMCVCVFFVCFLSLHFFTSLCISCSVHGAFEILFSKSRSVECVCVRQSELIAIVFVAILPLTTPHCNRLWFADRIKYVIR